MDLKELTFTLENTESYSISCIPSQYHTNVNGSIHGGILFLICDELVGRYVTHLERKGAAANSNIQFFRPSFPNQKIVATIFERKNGKRLGVYLVELRNEQDKLIAEATFTVAFA